MFEFHMPATAISISHLTKTFGTFTAVDNLHLDIPEGEVFGLLGPNGAGKSTTLRMLLTLIKPDSGEVLVHGKSLLSNRREALRQIGSIIEKPDFHLHLSAYDNLQIQARLSGVNPSRKELTDLLGDVGLSGREKDKVKTYSHGMKQRLGIAQALVHDPQIIILDEPTNGLDPQGIIDLRQLILQLKNEQGKTVILSSHILSEMERIADNMAIITRGKAVVQGKVATLLSNEDLIVEIEPQHPEACLMLLQQSGWQQKLGAVSGAVIQLQLSKSDIPELMNFLVQHHQPVFQVAYKRTLEDYFLKLTN